MKKTCSFVLSLFAAGALSAAMSAQSDNVIGVLRVDSTEKQTVVAIPWVAAGVNAGSIRVTDIVKTSTLTAGDQLFAYIDGAYKCWALDESNVWQPSQVVTASSVLPEAGTPAADQALTRGNAIVLVRQYPKNPGYFFVQGQVAASDDDVVNTLPAGVDSLLAPPSATATDLNSTAAVVWGLGAGDHTNDRILYKDEKGALRTAKLKEGAWKTFNTSTRAWTTDGVEIPAGQGAWYQNKSTEAVTVTWKAAPHL